MKLLENARLDTLSAAITMNTGNSQIDGRIESYSCKMAGGDKKLYKTLNEGTGPNELQALSPPQNTNACSVSPVRGYPGIQASARQRTLSASSQEEGVLCDTISGKMLFYLISTLNAAFNPDYDFSNAKSHEFCREQNLKEVIDCINGNLSAIIGERFVAIKTGLWAAVDEEINLVECDIFSYNPDLDSDPYGEEGSLWSFNYFFYNKKMKRIIFFTCRASSRSAQYQSGDEQFEMEAVDTSYEDSSFSRNSPILIT
ncbi:repressor of RNA polymerase III transcription MAF1 homolog isoform X1 [Montipora foliosa]|uniref:repressor of RNA polymerase III transcription MAF1 homolog isoform X1 n=1 Tax=Montipora foliosa TaxID=591990 RepID=UPI0035F1A96D